VFQTRAKLSMMCRLFFLDWDGWGFASAVEQNFNPSKENIKHREALGESTEKRKVRRKIIHFLFCRLFTFAVGRHVDPQNNVVYP